MSTDYSFLSFIEKEKDRMMEDEQFILTNVFNKIDSNETNQHNVFFEEKRHLVTSGK